MDYTRGICNAARDMMISWVYAEKQKGRIYRDMPHALPAFAAYLESLGWTQEQAGKLAAHAAESWLAVYA